jgi:hypothetical protein
MSSDLPQAAVPKPSASRQTGRSRPLAITLLALRWWFGVTYLLGGIGCVIAAPVWMASGNWGGIYLLGGGLVVLGAGWLIHPWGFGRHRRKAQMA